MTDPIAPLTPQQLTQDEYNALHEKYFHRVLEGLDQFFNVLTDGDPDETVSARASRADKAGKSWGRDLSRFLDIFQKNHGAMAQAGDLARATKIEQLDADPGVADPSSNYSG